MDRLQKYKTGLQSSAQKCQNFGSTERLDQTDGESEMMRQAAETSRHLEHNTQLVEQSLERIRETMLELESLEKMKLDLVNWLMAKQTEMKQLMERPAKLHHEAAVLELSHLNVCVCSSLKTVVDSLKLSVLYIKSITLMCTST